jgi:hypothetical protein
MSITDVPSFLSETIKECLINKPLEIYRHPFFMSGSSERVDYVFELIYDNLRDIEEYCELLRVSLIKKGYKGSKIFEQEGHDADSLKLYFFGIDIPERKIRRITITIYYGGLR